MDFVNAASKQLSELFRSMTPAARMTAALLLAVVVIGLAVLLKFPSGSPDDYLLGGHVFTTSDMTAAQAALAKAGLGDFEPEGNRIRIPRGQKDVYIAALLDGNALPRHVGYWFEQFDDKTSPFDSRKLIDIKMKFAIQNHLAQVIRCMRGIEYASVVFDEVKKGGLRREQEFTASVAVQPLGTARLDPDRVRTIREFIAASVGGLSAAKVAVMDMNGGVYSGTSPSGLPGAIDDVYATTKRMYEQGWTDKIREALAHIPGVTIVTNVLLDPELQHTLSSIKYDQQVATTRTEYENTVENSTDAGTGGRPGVATNLPMQGATVTQVKGPESEKEQQREVQEGVPSHEQLVSRKHGLTPKRVTATVGVPRSYYRKVWDERNRSDSGQPAGTPDAKALLDIETEIKTDIENKIVNLLPERQAGESKYPLVHVSTNDDLAVTPPPGPGMVEQSTTWLGRNWPTLGMLGVGLAGLLVLRGMIRSTPTPPEPSAAGPILSLVRPDEDMEEDEEQEPGKTRRRTFAAGGPNPREELTEMVNDNPEVAAAILRNWIGEAS